MPQRIALFPGSFDPITAGHEDLVYRALTLFDKVIVAVGYNANKSGFFPVDTRMEFLAKVFEGVDRVEVTKYQGLTIDFAREKGASVILRGLRSTSDFENELNIAQANRNLDERVETLFIPTEARYSFVSSTVVRDLLRHHRDPGNMLPKCLFKLCERSANLPEIG